MPNDHHPRRAGASVPALFAAVATVVGCTDVTAPPPLTTAPVVATASVARADSSDEAASMNERAQLAGAVADALSRVMPTLSPGPGVSRLQTAVEALQRSVDSSPTSLAASILAARQALEPLETAAENDAGLAAELSVLRLVLDRATETDRPIRSRAPTVARD